MKNFLTIVCIAAWLFHCPAFAAPQTAFQPEQAFQAAALLPDATNSTLPAAPNIAATAYWLHDLQSHYTIASKNAHSKIEPASLTKLMTAYLSFQALNNGNIHAEQQFTVSENAWRTEGARMFLEKGKKVKVSELLMGLVVQSGNDAAITLAEGISGSETAFVALMNQEAQKLGMLNTHFENSTGISSPKHLTTVSDLGILSTALIRDFPEYYPLYSEKSFTYNGITQSNRNLLLHRDSEVDGLASGHTPSAGYNLIASSKRGGRRILSIVVGTASTEARATESSKLLNHALQYFDTPKMYTANQSIAQVKIYKGAEKTVDAGFLQDTYFTVPRQGSHIKTLFESQQPVLAPIHKGQELGTLKLMANNQILSEHKVFALHDVAESGILRRIWDSIVLWFKLLFAD
ncbi:MAG: D-alanyl-D-alanine carboxypeptidase family protein [Alysiella sp.]|uniref:D-alanyl-D-alanine carboxypeptidase family protein n=1 Tax=Alysiella sp. TaxID=1872483 RepID=UPI0026DB1751|nr:D-alanyl-D-alanine carboxypeptidase family protein [Alysiella sp.]MDO4434270.1 D-alanyl-D-alanine carboxypeptidase family protein [Alysiella sp.]